MWSNRTQSLVAFLAVLTAGTVLTLHDAQSTLLAAVAVIVTDLYTVWRDNRRESGNKVRRNRRRGARPDQR